MEIPGYTLKRILGKGGMATVYLAEQDKFERDVAIKVMAPALSADPSFRERFLREAKIVAKISHPHIVAVYDVNEVNGVHYIAMEFHPGGDLKARIREGLGIKDALGITKDVAKALDYAHSKGYLHRDIKPDNVLFRADGSAVLTDFGIAKATEGDANLTQLGLVAGTPKYMSPEQARGQALEADSDLYSLGVVLFEMLTGRLPYEAADPIALGILHLNAPIPKLEGRLAHFQPLIDRLLAKNAAERPRRGAEAVRMVETLEASFDFSEPTATADDEATVFRPNLQNTASSSARPAVAAHQAAAAPTTTAIPAAAGGEKKKTGVLMAAVAGMAVVAGAVVFGLTHHGSTSAPPAATAEVPAVSATQTELSAAAAAFARGDWVTPVGQSAADHYHQVLKQDPANSIALTGLQQIASNLQQQGYAALAKHDVPAARESATQLQQFMPDYAGLPALQQAINAAAAPAPAVVTEKHETEPHEHKAKASAAQDPLTHLKIAGLLGRAQQALSDGDKATAASSYQQVLQLEPGNAEAKAGLKKAAN